MNYIDLINHFWKLNKEHSFTPNEKAVYFALLYKWNDLHRKNPFNQSTETLAADSGVSESTVQRARKVLKETGLINFQSGDGRKKNTVYTINNLTKGSHTDHLSKNKGGHKDTLLTEKGSQEGSHIDHLYTENAQKKVVTVTDNISKLIEERIPSIEEEKSEEKEEEFVPQKNPIPLGTSSVYSSMSDVEFICLNQSTIWHESMMKKFGIKDREEIKKWISEFFEKLENEGQDKRDLNDARSHCFRWINIQVEVAKDKLIKVQNEKPSRGVEAAMEWGKVERIRKS